MVSASNSWMTSLHKLEPEHEIKWLERFTVFRIPLAFGSYLHIVLYIDRYSLGFACRNTIVSQRSHLFATFPLSRQCQSLLSTHNMCKSMCLYLYSLYMFIHLYSLDISGLSYSTIILCSVLHTLELHCMIFHCTVFSHHLLQCHHLALHYIPWYTIIVSYYIYIMYYIYSTSNMSVIARLFLPSFQRKPTAYMDSCSISVPSEKPEVGSLSIIYTHPNVLFSLYFYSGIFRRTSACEASHCLFDFILGQRLLDVDGCMAPKL